MALHEREHTIRQLAARAGLPPQAAAADCQLDLTEGRCTVQPLIGYYLIVYRWYTL